MNPQSRKPQSVLQRISRKLRRNALYKRLPAAWTLNQARRTWDSRWANPEFTTSWLLTTIPPEITTGVQSQCLPPKCRIVDIGCGTGELAAWLASKGFEVLGIDFAHNAIRRAREKHQNVQGTLAWEVVDICKTAPGGKPFDVLIDRGCLHGIPPKHITRYAANTAACCKDGGRFLIYYKTTPVSANPKTQEAKAREITRMIQDHFKPAFEMISVETTILERSAGDTPKEPMAGLAFKMVRRV